MGPNSSHHYGSKWGHFRLAHSNTGCHCHGNPPQLHGPYLIWTRKVDNKTVTRTLDTTQADALRPLMDNSRRLRELTTELATLALQQVRNDPTQPDP